MYRSHYIQNALHRLILASVFTAAGLVTQAFMPLNPASAVVRADDAGTDANQPVPIQRSKLTGLKLADKAYTAGTKEQLSSVAANLTKAARKQGVTIEITSDAVEMIAWEGANAAPRTALYRELEKAGYTRTDYEAGKNEAVKYALFKAVGSKNTLFGMWIEDGENILVAWGRADAGSNTEEDADEKPVKPTRKLAKSETEEDSGSDEPLIVQVDARASVVNVMKGAMPRIPTFPKLTKKPGFVRGYVYDTKGNPLKGARIGARSTAAGGFYSGAQGKTDDKGYYEIEVPWGAAHFYCAGYAVDYGDGRAAMGLHPADGEAEGFATNVGEVENFVMLPYGIANRDAAQDDPRYCNNYYGGTIILSWSVNSGSTLFDSPQNLPVGSTVEITLTPEGPLVDGSRSRPIVIRKVASADSLNQLYVNNIPACAYKITAKLAGGGALHMKEAGPNGNQPFGLEPKEATGKANLLLRPSSAKPESALARQGNWQQISIVLSRP